MQDSSQPSIAKHPEAQDQIFINPNSTLPKNYFQLIEKVGSDGKYQKNLFYIQALILFATGSILLSPSFLYMNNQYACESLGLLVTQCKKSICQIQDTTLRQTYYVSNKDNIQSVASDYGPFMCQQQYILDIIKSSPYFGSLLGFIISSLVADNIGRKKLMVIALSVASVGTLMVTLGFNIVMVVIGVILAGGGINVSCGIVFYFLAQTVQNKKRQKYSILVQVSFTLGTMCITGLYALIGNWRVISIIIQTIPTIVSLFWFILYSQQTPMFILKNSNKQALRGLNRIGYINYGIKDILSEQDIQNVRTQQLSTQKFNNVKVNPLDLIRFKSIRPTIIVACLCNFVILNMYYGPSMIIDSIGFNTFVTSFVIQLSQLVSYIPIYYWIDKVNRKSTGFWLFFGTVITSFVLIFVQKPKDCDSFIFIFRFALGAQYILFMVYTVQLFPTRIVGVASSVVSVAGTAASTLSSIIIGSLERLQFNLMIFFFILGVVGLCCSILLKQTQNKPIQAQIEQIQFAKNKRKSQYISQIKIHNSNTGSYQNL